MRVEITIDESTLKRLVRDHINNQLGEMTVRDDEVKIEVKSKQNYKSEWETADYRAKVYINRP